MKSEVVEPVDVVGLIGEHGVGEESGERDGD